jgi:hypothetical protein
MQHDRVRARGEKLPRPLVDALCPEHHRHPIRRAELELPEVVLDTLEDVLGDPVSEDRVGPVIVQRFGVQRGEHGLLRAGQGDLLEGLTLGHLVKLHRLHKFMK